MNKLTFRLALPGLIVIALVYFSSFAVASADADAPDGPTLEGARVSPENGSWGSTFTYEVTYTDNENNMPAVVKVYIDGSPENMVEKNSTDNDVTDGKVYKYDWVTVKENVGPHSFYCYVETLTGENARDPATGTYDGPRVRWPVSLRRCKVDNPEPATGETIIFSGYLEKTEENVGVPGENLTLYKLLSANDVEISSATTNENGYFTFSLDAPSQGIFFYRVQFPGDNYYEASESSNVYVNTLDKPLVFGVYALILLALVGVLMFIFSRGIARAHYLKPVLLGFGLGFFLLFMGASFIGILAAGAITGYLFARETRKWTSHLRIGCMASFIFLLVFGLIFAYFLTGSPSALGFVFGREYSVTQMKVFKILFEWTIFFLVQYVLLVGMGAVLGGTLRKLLKPAEQKPIGSGETTSSGVEQQ